MVEFAVVGLVFFTVLFALIDFSRLFWNLAALDEATRRGARVAAVCPVNDPYVAQTALFDGLIPTVWRLEHIRVEYLDIDGAAVDQIQTAAGYGSISLRARQHPGFSVTDVYSRPAEDATDASFATTIPSESLGRVGTADVDC